LRPRCSIKFIKLAPIVRLTHNKQDAELPNLACHTLTGLFFTASSPILYFILTGSLIDFSHAPVERAYSYRARSASRRTARLPFPSSLLVISLGMGVIDLPLRASNEGLRRPRVARAKEHDRRPLFLFPFPLKPLNDKNRKGVCQTLDCARPTRAFGGRALREQESLADALPVLLLYCSIFRTLFSAAALSRLWLPSDPAHRCRRKTARR